MIPAIGVPDIRIHFVKQWQPHGFFAEGLLDRVNDAGLDVETDAVLRTARAMFDHIRAAELFWVSPDFMPLLIHAAGSLPADARFDDIPAPPRSGLLVFGGPAPFSDWLSGESDDELPDVEHAALSWGAADSMVMSRRDSGRFGVFMEAYAQVAGHWINIRSSSWAQGDTTTTRSDNPNRRDADAMVGSRIERDRRLLAAFLILMQERLVADTTWLPLPRHIRRRAEREGLPSDVRIVKLRELVGRPAREDDAAPVGWSHRWIVSGHWRRQACGPNREERRLTWIHPHIKGPTDKPLVVKESVKALVR